MFEKNLPPRNSKRDEKLEEEGGATGCGANGAAGGAFVAPAFPIQRRKMPTEIEESTTTFNTGDYEYTAPAFSKKSNGKNFLKPALKRHNGKGGSISINHVDDE